MTHIHICQLLLFGDMTRFPSHFVRTKTSLFLIFSLGLCHSVLTAPSDFRYQLNIPHGESSVYHYTEGDAYATSLVYSPDLDLASSHYSSYRPASHSSITFGSPSPYAQPSYQPEPYSYKPEPYSYRPEPRPYSYNPEPYAPGPRTYEGVSASHRVEKFVPGFRPSEQKVAIDYFRYPVNKAPQAYVYDAEQYQQDRYPTRIAKPEKIFRGDLPHVPKYNPRDKIDAPNAQYSPGGVVGVSNEIFEDLAQAFKRLSRSRRRSIRF
ncbi:unnamed protein product [Cyprideis torosa]|uniref:Uncharacterized protein n=1 Tax=Cyprideis torosa TaxID=163714 RepID=A0A7R8ZGK9_9CRUS|nr:unnamed protein product [Cyprideis torosa]CAG0881889.1 unnamed protein product [Cyprideis torosa]